VARRAARSVASVVLCLIGAPFVVWLLFALPGIGPATTRGAPWNFLFLITSIPLLSFALVCLPDLWRFGAIRWWVLALGGLLATMVFVAWYQAVWFAGGTLSELLFGFFRHGFRLMLRAFTSRNIGNIAVNAGLFLCIVIPCLLVLARMLRITNRLLLLRRPKPRQGVEPVGDTSSQARF
jgi:hypothetical protein